MKLINLRNKWDLMTPNAFDNLTAEESYDRLYKYAVELEDEVRKQRSTVAMYRLEVQNLNKAIYRKWSALSRIGQRVTRLLAMR